MATEDFNLLEALEQIRERETALLPALESIERETAPNLERALDEINAREAEIVRELERLSERKSLIVKDRAYFQD